MAAELPGKRAGASYQQALVGIGIAVDKEALLSGEATSWVEHRGESARARPAPTRQAGARAEPEHHGRRGTRDDTRQAAGLARRAYVGRVIAFPR